MNIPESNTAPSDNKSPRDVLLNAAIAGVVIALGICAYQSLSYIWPRPKLEPTPPPAEIRWANDIQGNLPTQARLRDKTVYLVYGLRADGAVVWGFGPEVNETNLTDTNDTN